MNTQRNVILRNSIFNLGGRFGSLVIGLVFTPYLVHKLGPTQFGLWCVTLAVTGVVGIVDLGIAPAIVKFVAELHSNKNFQGLADSILSGLFIAILMALVLIIAVWIFLHPIVKILQVPKELESITFDLLRGSSIIIGIAYLSNCFQSGLAGLQRMEFVNGIILSSSIVGAIASFVLLELGWGLRGLILSQALAAILAFFLGMYGFIHLVSIHFIACARPRLLLVRSLFKYGWKVQVSTTCGLGIPLLNKLLTSAYVGLRQAGVFEIGNRVTNYTNSIPISFFTALVPAWAESSVKLGSEELKAKYHQYFSYFLFLSLPFILFSISCAKPMVLAWIGRGFDQSVWVIQVLLLGYGVNLQTGVGTTLLRGIGKPEYEMIYGIITVGINVFLALILVKPLGFLGILLGAGAGQIIGSIIFLCLIRPFVGSHRWGETLRRPLLASLLPTILLLVLNHLEGPVAWLKMNRLSVLLILIIEALIFGGLFILLSLKSPLWGGLVRNLKDLTRNLFLTATIQDH